MYSVAIALGSNVGDRRYWLGRAIHELSQSMRVVRLSTIHETAPVDAPAGSGPFLNMVLVGCTSLPPRQLMLVTQQIESRLGRRRGPRNAPRTIDLDIILFSAFVLRDSAVVIPHPRYRQREFVRAPLRELELPWVDPVSGRRV